MRKLAFGGLVLVLLCGLGGCGKPKHDAVVNDMIVIMNDLCDVLDSVHDDASAQAAKPKMEKLAIRLKEVFQQALQLGDPSKAEEERLNQKFAEAEKKLDKRMEANAEKLEKYPFLFEPFAKALEEVEKNAKWLGGDKK